MIQLIRLNSLKIRCKIWRRSHAGKLSTKSPDVSFEQNCSKLVSVAFSLNLCFKYDWLVYNLNLSFLYVRGNIYIYSSF